jgi:hypothetical protein
LRRGKSYHTTQETPTPNINIPVKNTEFLSRKAFWNPKNGKRDAVIEALLESATVWCMFTHTTQQHTTQQQHTKISNIRINSRDK